MNVDLKIFILKYYLKNIKKCVLLWYIFQRNSIRKNFLIEIKRCAPVIKIAMKTIVIATANMISALLMGKICISRIEFKCAGSGKKNRHSVCFFVFEKLNFHRKISKIHVWFIVKTSFVLSKKKKIFKNPYWNFNKLHSTSSVVKHCFDVVEASLMITAV